MLVLVLGVRDNESCAFCPCFASHSAPVTTNRSVNNRRWFLAGAALPNQFVVAPLHGNLAALLGALANFLASQARRCSSQGRGLGQGDAMPCRCLGAIGRIRSPKEPREPNLAPP